MSDMLQWIERILARKFSYSLPTYMVVMVSKCKLLKIVTHKK